jgi:NB-ARC domain.
LALVDEVATDSATRGALKDDAAFKSLRDVIKRCNKVLERMLVRRENKYTLFYRLVQPHDSKDIEKMNAWNSKVEKAVSSLSPSQVSRGENQDDAGSVSSAASGSSIFSRGRRTNLGRRTRSRRATPTPRLRNRFRRDVNNDDANAAPTSADDGYATVTAGNVAKLQRSFSGDDRSGSVLIPKQFQKKKNMTQPKNNIMPIAPKDELVDMIRELRSEKNLNKSNNNGQGEDLKPNWTPKADVPGAVPKLPIEYIHRHRLMKQVVNSLINRPGAVSREDGDERNLAHMITSITSRHADKAGNGKTTLAAAAVQSVEVRERFCDGIAWIQLGRAPLSDMDVRRLYEEIYDQLLMRDIELKNISSKASGQNEEEDGSTIIASALLKSRRKFQGMDLEGIREDLGRMLTKKNVLICLDDVWRAEDAKRFIFDSGSNIGTDENSTRGEACPFRFLITTRTPGLMGEGQANEIFVRIFSEQEAVKLLLSAAGRRLYGGKDSPAFNEARIIVKGCGNSPLALRLAGGMLRTSNRNWTLSSRTWLILVEQCKANLEEASRIRSFVNAVGRISDLSFITVEDLVLRASLRRCFVTFAMVFHDNDLLLTGRGIPRGVIRRLFVNVISGMEFETNTEVLSPDIIIDMLEHLNLIQRAGHDAHLTASVSQSTMAFDGTVRKVKKVVSASLDEVPDDEDPIVTDDEMNSVHHKLSYLMHESVSR